MRCPIVPTPAAGGGTCLQQNRAVGWRIQRKDCQKGKARRCMHHCTGKNMRRLLYTQRRRKRYVLFCMPTERRALTRTLVVNCAVSARQRRESSKERERERGTPRVDTTASDGPAQSSPKLVKTLRPFFPFRTRTSISVPMQTPPKCAHAFQTSRADSIAG